MRVAIVVGGLLGSLLAIAPVSAQVGFPPPPPKVSPAAGVIDMHVHSHPDVFGRSMDDIDVATLAKAKGMRGIVLKNHVVTTADRAALVMKVVPGIEVWAASSSTKPWEASTQRQSSGCIGCMAAVARSSGCLPSIPTST